MPGLGLGLDQNSALMLYAAGIVACLLSIFWRPPVGLYYIILTLPLQTVRYRMHQYPLGQSILDIVLLGVIIGLYARKGSGPLFPKTTMDKVLVIFIFFYYVSLWRGAFYLGGELPFFITDLRFSDWKNYVELPLFFFVTAAVIKTPKQMKIVVLLMCVTTLMVNRGYYNTVSGRDFSHFAYNLRFAGTLGYAGENGLAAFEGQILLFLLGIYASLKKWLIKIPLVVVMVTCGYCLVYSFSRGAYFAVLVGLLYLGVVKKRSLVLLCLALLISWQSILPRSAQERLKMTYTDGQVDSSSEERLDIWADAMEVIRANPLIGTGYDTYQFMGRVGPYRDTHNLYMKVLLETGIFGLLLMVVLMKKSYSLGWSLSRRAHDPFIASIGMGFAAVMVCAILINIFGDRWTYQQVNGYLWIMMGCVARGHILTAEAVGSNTAVEPNAEPVSEEHAAVAL